MFEYVDFQNEEELGEYLTSVFEKSKAGRKRIVDHERAHYDMAKKLGYKPVYAIYGLINDRPAILAAILIRFHEREPTKRDMIKICLAPNKPSSADKRLAIKLEEELRRGVV